MTHKYEIRCVAIETPHGDHPTCFLEIAEVGAPISYGTEQVIHFYAFNPNMKQRHFCALVEKLLHKHQLHLLGIIS